MNSEKEMAREERQRLQKLKNVKYQSRLFREGSYYDVEFTVPDCDRILSVHLYGLQEEVKDNFLKEYKKVKPRILRITNMFPNSIVHEFEEYC